VADSTEQDDRTEEPTQKKLDEAIKRGDVAKSIEINTLFVLGGFALCLILLSSHVSRSLTLDLRAFLMNAHQVPSDGAGMTAIGEKAVWITLAAAGLPILVVSVAALMGGALQHRPLWTFQPLAPKFSRISPLNGFKRLFGKEAFVQFGKGLVKIGIVGAVASTVLWGEMDRLESLARLEPAGLLPVLLVLAMKLMGGVLAIYAFLAIGDAVYQRMSWYRRQRMSKQELKEEFKNTEGNPEVKAKLKQIRASRVKRRMMAAVPTATVVIANPTHFAVALKYERGMPAPLCVAKGVDAVALKIRAVAAENGVAVVENPPLARALHATVDIDQEIPVEHYKAVAEVIGAILRLRRRPA
jgi:flagellar biosynthetic protein FlhB